jgi:hypothetical protein
MIYFILIAFSALIILSNQKFGNKPRYTIISPNGR